MPTSVSLMSAAPTTTDDVVGVRSWRYGTLFAIGWLVFLVQPIRDAFALETTSGVAGGVSLLAFAVSYLYAVRGLRPVFRQEAMEHGSRVHAAIGAMIVLAVLAVLLLGVEALATGPYLAVVGPILMRRGAFLWVVACAAIVELVNIVHGRHWQDDSGLALSTLSAGLSVWGFALLMQRQRDQVRAAEAEGALALANERNRFGRDLHDILGHSLTVITVKAELAGKLIDVAPERARAEIADLERLSREALTDVRRAVEGYREITLAGELARARSALAAAGIQAQLPAAFDSLEPDLDELYAWTVREGVTNVLRHSGARTCTITFDRNGLSVSDDGKGVSHEQKAGKALSGNGIRGLEERATAIGCTARLESPSGGGTRLKVGPTP